jgi:hypothetical protein
MATAYQRKITMRRATGGIDRLASEFDKRMRELSGQQAADFGAYTRQVAETMAPYEQQMEQYRTTLLPEYERQRQSYQQSLQDFQAQLEELKRNPTITKTEQVEVPRGGLAGLLGRKKTITQEYQEPRPVPTFEQVAPVAPAMPEAPKIGEFETAGFEQRRKQLQSDLQRELGERRGARMAAVQRRPRGGLMQGA